MVLSVYVTPFTTELVEADLVLIRRPFPGPDMVLPEMTTFETVVSLSIEPTEIP
jgi:hypothetical protein